MRGKLVSERIEFNRSGDPIRGMDVGLRKDPNTIRIKAIVHYDPQKRQEYVLDGEDGEMFLTELLEGKIKEPHFYYLIGSNPAKRYNVFQYPPEGLIETPFIYGNTIWTIPESILYEDVNFQRGKDPRRSMGIGAEEAIHDWFDEHFPSFMPKYKINV